MIYELYLAVYMTDPPRITICDSDRMARSMIYDWQSWDFNRAEGDDPGYKMGHVYPFTVVIGAEGVESLEGEAVDNYGHLTDARKAG